MQTTFKATTVAGGATPKQNAPDLIQTGGAKSGCQTKKISSDILPLMIRLLAAEATQAALTRQTTALVRTAVRVAGQMGARHGI